MVNRIFGQRDIFRQNRQRERAGEGGDKIPPYWRPKVRADCLKGPRPCPFVACKHHLFLDVTPRGGLRVPYGEDPEAMYAMGDTCALDVAEKGGITLEAVAKLQGITRERVRQIELMALSRLEQAMAHIVANDPDFVVEKAPKAPPPSVHSANLHGDLGKRRQAPRVDLRGFTDR